jgi:ribonuclease HII
VFFTLKIESITASLNWIKMSYALRFSSDDDLVEVGVDEAGRGCLFGRLYVGAVVLPDELDSMFDNGAALMEIKDSKKLTERKRDILFDYVKECAVDHAIAWCSNEQIDKENILQADLNTMHKALESLSVPVQRVLVDGDSWKPWAANPEADVHKIIQGDSKYLAIAAASILAKVARDRWVNEICDANPEWGEKYGLRSNKGYGASKHMAALKTHGPTPLHRMSFAPCSGQEKKQKQKVNYVVEAPKNWIGIE